MNRDGVLTIGLLCAALLWLWPSTEGGASPKPDDDKPAPILEERYWDEMAEFVEEHPERHADTDRIYKIAERMQEMGYISDLDRLDSYKDKMRPIGSGEGAVSVQSVADTLRGK